MIKGASNGATPDPLMLRNRDAEEVDEDSSGPGSLIINSRAFGHHRRLISRQESRPVGDCYKRKNNSPFKNAGALVRMFLQAPFPPPNRTSLTQRMRKATPAGL